MLFLHPPLFMQKNFFLISPCAPLFLALQSRRYITHLHCGASLFMETLDVGNFELLSPHLKENNAGYLRADASPENVLPGSPLKRPSTAGAGVLQPSSKAGIHTPPLRRSKLVSASLCQVSTCHPEPWIPGSSSY